MSKKLSCLRCRRIKRKCDGENPCSNCHKRKISCEYNQEDKRSQRFSVGYIKSLESNNDLYESTLAALVGLRDDPEKLQSKLDLLASSFPLPLETARVQLYPEDITDEIRPASGSEDDAPPATLDDNEEYFGPGSIYNFANFTKPDKEPLVKPIVGLAITIEKDFNHVKLLVHHFFRYQHPNALSHYLDRDLILQELESGVSGDHLCEELIYAICANSGAITYDEADAYRDLVASKLFLRNWKLTVATAQAFMLLGVHELSRGQISNGWMFSGIAMRMGHDLGFDSALKADALTKNRLYIGFLIVDSYMCLAVGRRTSLAQMNLPVLRLPSELEVDYLNLKYSAQIVELTRLMLRATYEPVAFDKDAKVNYLLKFNRSKAFNVKLLKWKADLDKACHWLYASLKASKTLARENHTIKYMYYHYLLFINKPFLHVPKQHLSVYIIEEIAKEMLVIVLLQLEKIEEDETPVHIVPFTQADTYRWASMDVCMLILLSHVLVTLITEQPNHYLYLEKHLKVFARYLNLMSPRKYKANDNPIQRLMTRYYTFKATIKTGSEDGRSPVYDVNLLKEGIEVVDASPSLIPLSSSDPFSVHRNSYSHSMLLDDKPKQEKMSPQYQYTAPMYQVPFPEQKGPNFRQMEPPVPVPSQAGYPQHFQQQIPHHFQQTPQLQYQQHPQLQFQQAPLPHGLPQENNQVQIPLEQFQGYQQQNEQPQFQPQPVIFDSYQGVPQDIGYAYELDPYASSPDDPVDKMMDQLFSNTGAEFDTLRTDFNWDALFKEQYVKLE